MVCYGLGIYPVQSHDLISAEAAGRLYSNIPEVVLYLYKQEKKKKRKQFWV